MAHDLSREDLKRNELGEAVEAGMSFAETHLRLMLGIVVGVVVTAVVVWAAWAWRSSRIEAASEALGAAQRVAAGEIVASGAKPDDARNPTFASARERDEKAAALFTAIVDAHGDSGPAQASRLRLAEMAFAAGDRAAARQHYERVVATGDDYALAATASLGLAALDRAEGHTAELIARLQHDLANGRGPLPADVLLAELARTQEAAGQPADARTTWRRLVDEHPQSAWTAEARERLAATDAGTR